MIILGLVLVGLAAAATAGVVIGGGQQTAVEIGTLRVETTTSGFFLFGFGLAIALVGGAQLIVVGFKQWRRRRQELETLRSQAQPATVPTSAPAAGEATGSAEPEPAAEVERPAARGNEPAAIEGGRGPGEAGDTAPGRPATASSQAPAPQAPSPGEGQRQTSPGGQQPHRHR